MAVAEARKMEKDEGAKPVAAPGWLTNALTFLPRKLAELRSFLSEVKAELKKVTWPSKEEVRSTTVVVIATTFFFGFYLWGLDLVFSEVLSRFLKR
jgi:preprotein translocase subunit SecE